MGRILDRIMDFMAFLAALLMVGLAALVTYSIASRYVSLPYPTWVVQFSEYALLWLTFLGAAWLLRLEKHVSVDLLTARLGPKGQRVQKILHSLLGTMVCGVIFWNSFLLVWDQFRRGVLDIKVVDMPKYAILVIIPIGFIFLFLQFFRQFLVAIRSGSERR
ncbi:MAG: TRAP transporter small permease [Syntrophaceae bacterium]|nr:TRAP transporter small permease [Syntrophaceae bacterium]